MKNNYSAWRIDEKHFLHKWTDIKKLQFMARYAILAPSGHNTQPWNFKRKNQKLLLYADNSRRLPYSGIQANEPYVSLGCCLETLKLAAKGFGYNLSIKYVLQNDHIATISISKKTFAEPSLLQAITNRVSNRNYYKLEREGLPNPILEKIIKANYLNTSAYILSKKEDIAFVAKLTTRSTFNVMGDKNFRVELSKWVRNNFTKQYDGMPGFVQGIPAPLSLFAKHVIKYVNISKDQARKDSKRVLHSANLVIITIKTLTPETLLNAGRFYARICVRAQAQNIATAGVGTAIIDPSTKKEIVQKYKLSGQPVAIIRLGKTDKKARKTPRWPFENVTTTLN